MKQLLAISIVLAAGVVQAQEKAYEAVGASTVVSGDTDTARRRALDDAFRQAVDQAVTEVIPEDARKKAGDAIKKRILRRAKAYALRHKIIEEKEEGGSYLVHIEAQVAVGALKKDLAAIGVGVPAAGPTEVAGPAPAPSRPKLVLLLVTRDGHGVWQTFGSKAGDPGPLAALVQDELSARGFAVVSAAGVTPPVAGEGGGGEVPLSDAQAAEVARQVGARAAVVGGAVLRDGGKVRSTSFLDGEADLILRVVEGTTLVAEVRLLGAGYAADRAGALSGAVRNAASRAMRALGEKLAQRWPSDSQPKVGTGVTVRVRGASRWSDAAELQKALSQAPGVRSVLPGRFYQKEIAFVVVGGDKGSLARALQAAPLLPASIVQQAPDGTLVVDRPAGQTVPGP